MYALSAKLPEAAHSDPVHYYTPEGTEAFTNQVLHYLAEAMELQDIPTYQEQLYTDAPIGI